MSQRVHSCVNNMNFDSVNSEAYSAKLQPRRRVDAPVPRSGQPTKRERSSSRARSSTGQAIVSQNQNQHLSKARTTNVRRQNENLKCETTSNVIHKELYTDNPALVEVTVKTHNMNQPSRSNSASRREPWSKLLKVQNSFENISSFHNFDPLRTLHFLAKELQNRLVASLPNDKGIQQMVNDMQFALSRIPPEVASTVALLENRKGSNSDIRTQKHSPYLKDEPDEYIIQVVKAPTTEKGCQTLRSNYAEAEKLQKHLEESSAKIETACKQMENVCTRLKSEKEELEIMLRAERETVKFLRKQIEDTESEKSDATNTKVLLLQQERDNLQAQVKKLKSQLDSQQDASSLEVKNTLQELRKQKSEAEEEITVLNHQITLSNMEKEKYIAILAARDRQIKDIRTEMSQLQDVVNEQLIELQNAPSSITSSITNITSDWLTRSKEISKQDICDNADVKEDYALPLFARKNFKERPSGDDGATIIPQKEKKLDSFKKSQQERSLQKLTDRPTETQATIRDMFAEIKKQALMVSTHPDRSSDTDTFPSDQNVKK